MTDAVLSLVGISAKGGKAKSGEFAVEEAIKSFKAYLVIIAADASENTTKKFSDMCTYREIPFYKYATKETLGRALGKDVRSACAITDEGLANALIKKLVAMEEKN